MKQALTITLIMMIFGWFWLYPRKTELDQVDLAALPATYVEIKIEGAVVFPGTYHFFDLISVEKALTYAGGLTTDADLSSINMSLILTSNQTIRIASLESTDEVPIILLNVNRASFSELISIPGLTEIRAASLIIYREQYGDFKQLDDLINVNNIGTVTLEKIKPYLSLG
ncbi:MAG: helix-hairpin-helix domain-containing protein [Acholeplasmataceae bacterium]|nr:helix-hairpin-helix domain-containing protein [Acholeplasmataceae bacterium]